MVFNEMFGQQTDESDKYFLDAFGNLIMNDDMVLRVLQVEQEDGIKQAQHLVFVNVVGLQVTDDFAHFRGQMLCGIGWHCLLRFVQLHDRQVGDLHEVVECGLIHGGMFVGHQA